MNNTINEATDTKTNSIIGGNAADTESNTVPNGKGSKINYRIRPYQRCTRCVMDTTDSKITFDENGVCDHCRNFDKNIAPYWKPKEKDRKSVV